MKEKYICVSQNSVVEYQESKRYNFKKSNTIEQSFRVHKDGMVGVHYQVGNMSDEEGYKLAEENLVKNRPYPFELETGVRSRNKVERELTDKELMDIADECVKYLRDTYPRFIYTVSFEQSKVIRRITNDKGMDYDMSDCAVNVSVIFKHVDSKDIQDGNFGFSLRDFDKNVFIKMADDILANYENEVELPEEIIIDEQYYGLMSKLNQSLDGENLALGTSLLSGKIGEKVFSEDFTLSHDVSEEDCWFNTFWDGDGCVNENDKVVFIDKGVVLRGYADKKTAKKYGVEHTKTAYHDFADIPGAGATRLVIERSTKTVKELLNGRYCVIPIQCSGGGFKENGDYTMPVQCSLLCDGEKILGKLPPFTMATNMFDMFGKDFIGVGSDKPIYNDKQILFRVQKRDI